MLLGFPDEVPDAVDTVVFGHEPPLAVGPDGVRQLPVTGGLPLGMAELGTGPPPVRRLRLAPEETLLVVTDGVTEARDRQGCFSPARRGGRPRDRRRPGGDRPRGGWSPWSARAPCGTAGADWDDTTVFAVRRPQVR
ncbi:Integral membrane protein OS=Streptomyces fumanus OX=67302 GN=GCM10018772_11640 PE=4 SV=1 [Streptomyces fumanus]